MSRRRRAREVVMQLLFRDDMNGVGDGSTDQQFLSRRLNRNASLIGFADTILQGVRQNKESIDEKLESTTVNWSLGRMAVTDRNVMRIAAWEILFGETPPRVAINEAIELSKRYGDENSSRFVNGVLDKLMQEAHTES
ncbi:MAG: transcription antitermination factor NusB [Planctomycetaceae bacterium]|nr:transcription antitermination factor NusB [Planctomycetaceae bacterium]MCP4462326.1 transcription antitermination factor NusB [Planctomycetaceae bacterium]MDG1806589.1 transcription antitermination factor NusB [Pirellulaceae bacterium]MDG2103628.1 transcription antitermination factor NusB [Pirellulaceae bacterium]